MGFSRQKYWSGLPLPPPGDLPNPGIEPRSPAMQGDSLKSEPPGRQLYTWISLQLRKDRNGDTLFSVLEGTSLKFLGKTQQPRAPLVRMRFSKVPTVAHKTPAHHFLIQHLYLSEHPREGFASGSVGKNPPASAGDAGDMGLIPRLGRSPGGGHGNPPRCACLENPTDRGAWRATAHGVASVRHDLGTKPPLPYPREVCSREREQHRRRPRGGYLAGRSEWPK